jgi:flagellar biosynthesis chaperone FliJ
MLKQARAFGVGLILATQNPVDVDYKALSNAGSWFVGKLQTERDKNRLLDGLQSASADLDRDAYSDIISALGRRTFLLHNIHATAPVLFQTRWTMNFLAGPLTRPQIAPLNRLANAPLPPQRLKPTKAPEADIAFSLDATQPIVTAIGEAGLDHYQPIPNPSAESAPEPEPVYPSLSPSTVHSPPSDLPGSETRPVVPSGIDEYYLPLNLSVPEAFKIAKEPMPIDAKLIGVLYRPALLGAAKVRFFDRRYSVDSEIIRDALVDTLDRRGMVRWDDFPYNGPDLAKMDNQPAPQARFEALDPPFADGKLLTSLQKDFADWVYRSTKITARANNALKVFAGPDISPADFRATCAEVAREGRDAEIIKTTLQVDRQITTLQDRLTREERKMSKQEAEYNNRKWEENATHAENIFGVFTGKGSMRKVSTSITKRRLSEQAKADMDESATQVREYELQLRELEQRRNEIVESVNEKWAALVNQVNEIQLPAKRSDVYVEYFGVAWQPFYLVRAAGEVYELPGSGVE